MRVDKLFSSLGLLSRSECKKAVKAGHITIDGRIVKSSDEHVDPENNQVSYKGNPINCSVFVYYMFYKPAGVVTANSDSDHKTVFDFISDRRPDLSAIGRLDKDTTGILLITNDGQLNHKLLSAKYHVPKTYIVNAEGNLNEADLEMLKNGVDIGDETPTLPARAEIIGLHDLGSTVSLTIVEGRYHQVKRMFEKTGHPVLKLHRQSFGPLILDPALEPGQFRTLTQAEVDALSAECSK